MKIEGWRYYNHAALPNCPPHVSVETTPIEDGSIWKMVGGPLLARWTESFDVPYETSWWYVIKDTPFDINQLKAKRRYEINKGIKNFHVEQIDPRDFKQQLYEVQIAAFSEYPEKYRPVVDKQKFFDSIDEWDKKVVYGAFYVDTEELCGYCLTRANGDRCIEFEVQKTSPEFEKFGVNAALVYKMLCGNEQNLLDGAYICDGSRSINHETNFQNYLEKYFEFRKAYCILRVCYSPKIFWIVKIAYPFRKILKKFDSNGLIHKINGILKMEELVRN